MALQQGSDPKAASSLRRPVISRPPTQLPEGYSPPAPPPGYLPRRPTLQTSGALAKSSRRTALSRRQIVALALSVAGIITGLVIAALILVNTLVFQTTTSPETTVQTFYSALVTQDYAHAYDQLAPSAKAAQSEEHFASHYTQLDILGGPVANFTINGVTTNGAHASVTIVFHRVNMPGRETVDTAQLAQSNGAWLITSIVSHDQAVGAP